MKRALLALILALPLAVSAQFRIVGTGLFTTLNDSTYRAKIDFRPDLTGNSYNATQLNDSMLVLSQKGQLYRLDSFYNASFSSAFIIVVEKNGNWGSPVGQIMVFQNNSSLAAPQAVYGANGATAGMQAGVDTWNALLLKVVSDSAVYWNQAYSNSIDSLNVSGDSLKTITLYRASGDSISATFVDGGGSGPVTDTLTGEVKGPLDSTYIDTVANIIFTTTTDTTVGVGELEYNDTQGSLIQGLKGGNVTNVIGQQIHQRVTNATGGPLTKGTAVFLHGSQGNRITVRKALATADSTSANTFGIVAESIADNQSGYVITEGLITNMNTNTLTEGAAVYLSPTVAGELTTTKPQAPQHTVYIGVCVKQHTGSGELFVKIRNGQELDELHDVRITSPVSNASLYYNASESVWRDTTPAALKSDISGTTNRLAMFTGSNTVGNSVVDVTSDTVSIRDYSNSYTTWRFHSNINKRGFIGYPSGTRFYSLVNPSSYAGFMYGDRSAGAQDQQAFTQLTAWNGGGAAGGFFSAATTLNGADSTLYFNISGLSANANPTFPAAQMVIQKGGNVGINTTTPAYRLDVNGDVNTTGMYKKSGTDIISGTTNYIPKFTGANTIGNSGFIENGQEVYLGGTANAFNFSRFSIYYNPRNNGFPIVSDTRNYATYTGAGDLITPSGGWSFGGKYNSSDELTAFASIQGKKEDLTQSRKGSMIFSTNDDTPGDLFPKERMRITSAGNVGIANNTPTNLLDVGSTSTGPTSTIGIKTNTVAATTRVAFENGTSVKGDVLTTSNATVIGTGGMAIQTTTNHPIIFRTNSSGVESGGNERMRIAQDGNIGIGTAAPRTPLDIRFSGSYPNYYTDTIARVEFNETGAGCCMDITGMYVKANGGGGQSNVGIIGEGGGVNYDKSIGIKGIAKHNDTQGPGIAYGVIGEVSASKLGSSGAIGTTIAGYFKNTAKVDGTHYGILVETDSSGDYGVYQTGFGANYFKGNVGIATSSPSRPLHVNANSSMIIPSGATGTRPASGADGDIRYNTTNANFEWYSGAGWREPVNAARSPAAGLANRFSKFDANGLLDTSAVLVQANGRIGIWNSPAVGDSALTVTGGIMATTGVRATRLNVNTSGTQVLSINNYSGNANASPNNVFIGNGGQSATGLGTQGRNNVGIGANALLSITTGEGSIGIGTNTMALRAQIMQSNIAIGNNAMQAQGSVQNSDNTAIGTNALRYNKGGNYNVALGSNALTQNTASFNNDTAGVNSGSNNFGLGFNACYWNGAGLQNIGIGSSANYFNRNGSYNIAIGGSALAGGSADRDTVAKNNNVVIGTQALQFLKGNGTGNSDENVAIGHYAGRSSGSGAGVSFTAGKTSVYIGAYTRAKDTVNQNEIVIGYSAIGNGSNTTTIGNSSTTNTVIPAGSLTVDVMRRKAPVTVTGNHTVADGTSWLICNGTAAIALTLPAASSWTGREIMVKTIQPQAVNSATSNVVPIDGVATGTAILPATDGAWCTLVSDGTNWIIMQRGS